MSQAIKRSVLSLLAMLVILGLPGQMAWAQSERPALDQVMATAKAQITEVTVAQASQMMRMFPAMVIVDVRQDHEYAAGHLPRAVNIDRGLLEFRIEKTIGNKSAKLLVYCKSGGRSALATKTLMDMGYRDVRSMAGGYNAWIKAGNPIVR